MAELNGFRLEEHVGRGPWGALYRATHVGTGVDAALKVATRDLTGARATQFLRGAHAAARLHHPGFTTILDYGCTADDQEIAAPGNSPYVAMSWARRGTLADLVPVADWYRVREIVLELLNSLGHAHARGLVHGNLKPSNVLVDERETLSLSDLGLSPRSAEGRAELPATPAAMRWLAPEQIRGNRRDEGPWTDPYGLGCLVFWLLTYRAPYHQGDADDIAHGHLSAPIPRLKSRIPLPHDIESWLRRLLAKDPNDRYRFAADAAYDLLQFPDEISVPLDESERTDPHSVETWPEDEMEMALGGHEPVGLEEPSSYASFETSAIPVRLTPCPPPGSWVRAEAPLMPPGQMAASLDLWRLRPTRLVNLEEERDALWTALHEVHREGEPRVVIVRGATGSGKSELARWLTERAHELGAAHTLIATHGQIPGRYDGVAAMAADAFGVGGLAAQQAAGRIRDELDALQHEGQLELLRLGELTEQTRVHARGPVADDARQHWWNAWARYLALLSTDRPVILWFDDVQWGRDALDFVDWLLHQSRESPRVLCVLTVDESLSERPAEADRLQHLLEHAEADVISLENQPRAQFARDALLLDAESAEFVSKASDGNPLLMSQIVADRVTRGDVKIDEDGLHLEIGDPEETVEELNAIWTGQVELVHQGREAPDASRSALEIATILGGSISRKDWEAVCTAEQIAIPDDLEEALLRAGLITPTTVGWSFCHPTLHTAVYSSVDDDRRARWHSAYADYVREIAGLDSETVERYAWHLVQAGRLQEALQPMLEAASVHSRRGWDTSAALLFSSFQEVLAKVGDAAQLQMEVRRLLYEAQWAASGAEELSTRLQAAEDRAAELEDEELLTEIAVARLRSRKSRKARSSRNCPETGALAQRLADLAGHRTDASAAEAWAELGALHRLNGERDEAIACFEKAHAILNTLDEDAGTGEPELQLAALFRETGDWYSHRVYTEAAIAAFEEARNYTALGLAYHERGIGLRNAGAHTESLETLGMALDHLPAGHPATGPALIAIGLTHVHDGAWREARDWLRRAMANCSEHRNGRCTVYIELGMAVCAAAERRWQKMEDLTDAALPRIVSIRSPDLEIALLLAQAGDLCNKAAEFKRATEFWELAAAQWEQLGDDERVDDLNARIQNLRGA